MAINSEPIYAELFTQVCNSYAWVTKQRRLRHPDDIKAVNMPAVFQVQMTDDNEPDIEIKKYGNKSVSEDILRVNLLIWVHASTGGEWVTSIINPIVDSLKSRFGVSEIPRGNVVFNTLNGLVQYAMVSGKIEFHESAKSDSILVVVPIKILAFN